MTIEIDADLFQTLLDNLETSGGKTGISSLLSLWEEKFETAPSQATIYRWLHGDFPRTTERLWQLGGVLNVDPIALIDFNKVTEEDIYKLIPAVQFNLWSTKSGLRFFEQFLGRQADWPPKEYAEPYFNHLWNINDFSHLCTLDKNYYQVIELSSSTQTHTQKPQIFHFAYRAEHAFGGRWLQYAYSGRT